MRPTEPFERSAEQSPDAVCFVFGTQYHSYAAVARQMRRIANRFNAADLSAGAHGAILSPNDPVAFTCTLGLLHAGMVWLPLNPRNSIAENALVLAELDCDILFVHRSFAAAIDTLRDGAPHIREVVLLDDLEAWLGDADDAPVATEDDAGALAAISATSGTTGRPKGVMLSYTNFDAFTQGLAETLRGDTPPVYAAAAPMTHVGGRICFSVLALGGTVVVLSRPDPLAILDAIESQHVTDLFLPPTAIYSLLDEPRLDSTDLSSLRHLMYGSAPMRVDMLRRSLETFGPVMVQGFGQTEAPLLMATLTPEDHFVDGKIAPDERLASAGRPTRFVTLAILDEQGGHRPTGEIGEVCVRGDIVMAGYYKDPEATAAVSEFGWHHTGDVGYLNEDGFLHLVDRKKDMIVSGGFNVYSAEVEQVLLEDLAVAEAVVIGVPDPKWGEAVKAIVTAAPGHTVDVAQLTANARQRLGGVKCPKTIDVWTELPRNSAGKILKRQIREGFWAGHDRRV
ncbi:AMP-binding protein [Mycobacterium simiae]|uniref:AMP-binding protein n=1 Tax=Mycobacterium simiae TaxID=1784 RepID=UPI0026333170|nr:AMP-binding protein [Mycobacterium simiae]